MTQPTPTDFTVPVATAPAPSEQAADVAKVAEKLVRTKTFLKNSFKNVGLPVLIGAAAAFVATRKSGGTDEDGNVVDGEIIDTTVE